MADLEIGKYHKATPTGERAEVRIRAYGKHVETPNANVKIIIKAKIRHYPSRQLKTMVLIADPDNGQLLHYGDKSPFFCSNAAEVLKSVSDLMKQVRSL